jgi:Asp-tRNA(Asn)/Glu-tRNA(Gln) amidotransferase A subunit family amidase
MTGIDHGDPTRKAPRAPRLALVMGPTADQAAPETIALIERAAEACRRAGAEVVPLTLPAACAAAVDAHPHVMNMESAEAIGWEVDHAGAQLSPVLAERMGWARTQPVAKLVEGRIAFAAARAAYADAVAGFDAVLTPSAPGEAPEGLGWTGDPAFNTLWTLLHVPCATVPAGTGPRGLPLGVQVAGKVGGDAALLAWTEWVRHAVG